MCIRDSCHCNWIYHKSHGAEMFSFVSWNLIGSVASVTKEQGINKMCIRDRDRLALAC